MNTGFFAKYFGVMAVIGLLAACGGGSSSSPSAAAITAQPTDQSVVAGATATFEVVASNATGYQWQRSTDGGTTFTDIGAATTASHTTPVTTLADSGTRYRVVVSGNGNSVTSSAVTLTVTAVAVAPSISVQPANQSISAGQDVSFSVTAGGTSLSYQWQHSSDGGANFTDIAGAGDATLTLTAVPLTGNAHQYRVVVSNSVGSVTSNAATLTVNAAAVAPAFTTQPVDVTIAEGQNAQFTVVVSGTPTPTLQWQLSTDSGAYWSDINGATGATFSIINPALANDGRQFRVVASNSAGTATSNAASLTVNAVAAAPVFTTQPANVTLTEGQNAQFMVAVSGTPTPTLQWQLSTDGGSNWSNITGATNTALDLTGVALVNNGRQFRAVASNSTGTVNSDAATLTVNAASSTNAILVSATPSGVVSNAESNTSSISTDGRWVAFATQSEAASNLVADGFGGGAYLHDMSTRATTRINVRPDGGYSSQSVVSHLKLAADGQHALFTSYANDLVDGDTNNVLDVFVRNLQTGVTTRENVLPDGSQDNVSGNAGHPFPPDISADGRWVLMWSQVNLAGAGDYVGSGLFLRDRQTGVTRSVVPIGAGLIGAALSASGQYVVSVTTSSAPYTYHLDVYNVAQSSTTRLLSVPYDNGLGGDIHGVVSVSDEGRFVACSVRSPTLVGGVAATNYQTAVLDLGLADPVAGMELVSVTDAGVAGSGGSSTRPQLSGDGRYVLFASRATNLAVETSADTLLVRDRQAGTTRVASRRIDGTPASGGIGMGSEALTRDGAMVVFMGDMWKIVDPTGNSGTGWQIFRVGRP